MMGTQTREIGAILVPLPPSMNPRLNKNYMLAKSQCMYIIMIYVDLLLPFCDDEQTVLRHSSDLEIGRRYVMIIRVSRVGVYVCIINLHVHVIIRVQI